MPTHSVKQGEDIDSIAFEYGFHPATIWDLDENKSLREKRNDPDVLLEDDEVVLPELEPFEVKLQTKQKHTFYRKGVPSTLRVKLCIDDKARAEIPYIFKIETRCKKPIKDVKSSTDKQGFLIEAIPSNATAGEIILDPGADGEEQIPFKLGHLNPANDGFEGVQSRLKNLGLYSGKIDNKLGKQTILAIREFQIQVMELKSDQLMLLDAKEVDSDTLEALEEAYSK